MEGASAPKTWLEQHFFKALVHFYEDIRMKASSYINWGTTLGSGGYGIRDNAGVIEFKSSGGSWGGLSPSDQLYLDVKDYGAVGDGTTDDTTAIGSAITAASTNPVRTTVFFPQGRYKITSSLSLPFGVSLLGVGTTSAGATFYGSALVGTGAQYVISIDHSATSDGHNRISNLAIVNGDTAAIQVKDTQLVYISDCYISTSTIGVAFQGGNIDCSVKDTIFGGTPTYSIKVDGTYCTHLNLDNIYCSPGGTSAGIYMKSSAGGITALLRNVAVESCSGPGVYLDPVASQSMLVDLFGCYFESNVTADIDINPNSNNATVVVNCFGNVHAGAAVCDQMVRMNIYTTALTAIGCYGSGYNTCSFNLGDLTATSAKVVIQGCILDQNLSSSNPSLTTQKDLFWCSPYNKQHTVYGTEIHTNYSDYSVMTAPGAPAASTARLYCDTSGGKVRLMARFPSGVAQQIAAEP